MTLSIQTRCPQCYSLFDVLEEQLDQADVKGRCGQCQQVFLVNDHLVVSADDQPAMLENDFENNKGIFNQNGIENIAGRGSYNFASVIYRVASDTGLNTDAVKATTKTNKNKSDKKGVKSPNIKDTQRSGEHDLEAAALDSFNAWQNPINKTTHNDDLHANSKQQLIDKVNKTSSNSVAAAAAIDAKAPTTSASIKAKPAQHSAVINKDKSPARSAVVSHPTNDKRIDQQSSTDNRAQQKSDEKISTNKLVKKEQSLSDRSPSVTHLTHLLTNKNTILDYKPSLNQQYSNPMLDRVQPTVAPASRSASTPVATLLWIAGCAVLILLLIAQYIIFNLNTLIKNPVHAKRLQAICSVVVCGLPNADLSALNTTQLSIRRSRVNTYADFSDLQAELVNSSAQAQLLPNLKVSVYSEAGLLGAFIATPGDYLLSNQSQLGGEQSLGIMFTIPLSAQKINSFTIEPIY
ncbi:zinc-ribbon and DUF3426 domain-containing protein [Psychrobacter sp. M13]|uniref:zinc-ribbon and DUF3426 domain-containing protein n=1 Tax=Psychrobacter sp. M13 TaxID=3067275 RepID=UPI00273B1387|nr:zinc-ribbon and DUF3426 domain-containing protein [Psychrobacter sp. M13]WLP95431.1 zinc-ribbon and DUF3426 domain-containing protein [Psychrobacter sp. M13]